MLRALVCSIICIAKSIKQKSVTKFKRWLLWKAQRVVITVKVRDVLGSSRQAHHQYFIYYFSRRIWGQKYFFNFGRAKILTVPIYLYYKSLYMNNNSRCHCYSIATTIATVALDLAAVAVLRACVPSPDQPKNSVGPKA